MAFAAAAARHIAPADLVRLVDRSMMARHVIKRVEGSIASMKIAFIDWTWQLGQFRGLRMLLVDRFLMARHVIKRVIG